MAYGLSNGHETYDVTWPSKVLLGSTVGYPSGSLASCFFVAFVDCVHFYRAMHYSAKRGLAIACRLSVCLSVTLVDRDHIGWNSSKIISPSVSMGCSLLATQTSRVYSKGNTPKFSPGGAEKSGFRRTKALIFLKHGKIGPRLLLRSNRKLYTRFRLVPKNQWPWMTLTWMTSRLALNTDRIVPRSDNTIASQWRFEHKNKDRTRTQTWQ